MPVISDNIRGAGLMMASMTAFTLNDACMKGLSTALPLAQSIFLRGIGTSVMLLVLAWALGGLRLNLPRQQWTLVGMRSVTEIFGAYFFISALYHMPFANVSAILQVLPLSITLAGALFLRESVGWRRFSAIMVGFFGVLLIVRPGSEGFSAYSINALLCVVMVTGRDLLARRISRDVPTLTVALANAVVVMAAFGIGTMFEDWVPVTGHAALQLGGASVLIIGGYVFSVSAMRVGEIAVVAPFRYTSLLCAIILGLIFFGEIPDRLTLVGSAIVVAMGVYTFYRERKIGQAVTIARPIR